METIVFPDIDEDGTGLEKIDEVGITGVMRVGQNHLVPGFKERREDHEHGRGRAGRDHDVGRRYVHPVLSMVIFGDGFAKFQNTQAVCVVGVAVADGFPSGFLDTFRSIEVWFSDFHMNHVHPGPLDLLGSLQDIHDDKGWYVLGAASNHY